MADTEYTAEETARYLHRLEDRIEALESRLPKSDRCSPVPDALTVAQAARFAGVSRRTIYNWIDAGKVRSGKAPSGVNRVYTDSLRPTPVEA